MLYYARRARALLMEARARSDAARDDVAARLRAHAARLRTHADIKDALFQTSAVVAVDDRKRLYVGEKMFVAVAAPRAARQEDDEISLFSSPRRHAPQKERARCSCHVTHT